MQCVTATLQAMAGLTAFTDALFNWQQLALEDRADEVRRTEMLQCFQKLGAWQADVVLDIASVAAGYEYCDFFPVWSSCMDFGCAVTPSEVLDGWLQQLVECGLKKNSHRMWLDDTLEDFARSVLLDPAWKSTWTGTRLWVDREEAADGSTQLHVKGGQQVSGAQMLCRHT
jgi:hypothetical protein